jgi:hypothetical protein
MVDLSRNEVVVAAGVAGGVVVEVGWAVLRSDYVGHG